MCSIAEVKVVVEQFAQIVIYAHLIYVNLFMQHFSRNLALCGYYGHYSKDPDWRVGLNSGAQKIVKAFIVTGIE